MQVYFDNAASTKPLDTVIKKITEVMVNNYANPASMSILGMDAENIIIQSKKTLGRFLNADYNEIYFTSGGTESNNWAINGTALGYFRRGKHIITTKIEHPAVTVPISNLENNGFEITYLNVDQKGYINLDEFKSAIRKDTILVSIILINNEIGTIQKIDEIGTIIKTINPNTLLHVDGVQAFGKHHINLKKSKIDMLSVSGHKFHGPKGVGILFIKKGLKVKPFIYGGGHQGGMRGGTENTPMAAAMALAADECYSDIESHTLHVFNIKKALSYGILNNIPDTCLNGEDIEQASPYVLSISFKDVKSEVLLHALENKGIFVSSGSACNSNKKTNNAVLSAIGLSDNIIQGAVRFSFSYFNTMEEVSYCLDTLKEIVPILRRFNR